MFWRKLALGHDCGIKLNTFMTHKFLLNLFRIIYTFFIHIRNNIIYKLPLSLVRARISYLVVGVYRFITGAARLRSTAKLQSSVCLEWLQFTSRYKVFAEIDLETKYWEIWRALLRARHLSVAFRSRSLKVSTTWKSLRLVTRFLCICYS